MKKIIFTLITFLTISSLFANSTELFNYNESEINEEFTELNILENKVNSLSDAELTSLLNNNFKLNNISFPSIFDDDPKPDVAFPFCWGCFFGPFGWAYVLVATNRLRKPSFAAFRGCMIGSAFYLFITVGAHELWGWWPGLYSYF